MLEFENVLQISELNIIFLGTNIGVDITNTQGNRYLLMIIRG